MEQIFQPQHLAEMILGALEVGISTILLLSIMNRTLCRIRVSYVQSLMLPLYVSAIVALAFATLLIGVVNILGYMTGSPVSFIVKWFVIRAASDILGIFLVQPGIGLNSLTRSVFYGISITSFNSVVVLVVYVCLNFKALLVASCVILFELALGYILFLILPLQVLSKRPAFSKYGLLSLLILLIQWSFLIAYVMRQSSEDTKDPLDSSSNIAVAVLIVFEATEFLQIIFIFLAFALDSRFWQGLYVDHKNVQLNRPMMGVWDFDRDLANVVTSSLLLLERKVVPIIPFSKLRLDDSKYFSGGSARVYRGNYLQENVAIKILFCIDLTPERIISFCEEATLLNSLQHENILRCHGVAIMPPALSLVTEFCINGSLFDFLHAFKSIKSMQHLVLLSQFNEASQAVSSQQSDRQSTSCTVSMPSSHSDQFTNANDKSKVVMKEEKSRQKPRDFWYTSFLNRLGLYKDREVNSNANSDAVLNKMWRSSEQSLDFPLLCGQGAEKTDKELSSLGQATKISLWNQNIGPDDNSLEHNKGSVSVTAQNILDSELGLESAANSNLTEEVRRQTESQSKAIDDSSRSISLKLKSPSAVMLTREMGFGLGPGREGMRGDYLWESKSRKLSKSLSLSLTRMKAMGSERMSQDSNHKDSLLLITKDKTFSFQSNNILAEGMLWDESTSRKMVSLLLPVTCRLRMMRDCCAGLGHLHSKGFMHCDIKSLNFLVTEDLTVKLADLGEARPITEENKELSQHALNRGLPSNINWSSPETLLLSLSMVTKIGCEVPQITSEHCNVVTVCETADVWSLTMVLYEIATGVVPFDDVRYASVSLPAFIDLLKEGLRPEVIQINKDAETSSFSSVYLSWLQKMLDRGWTYDPKLRSSCADLQQIIEAQIR